MNLHEHFVALKEQMKDGFSHNNLAPMILLRMKLWGVIHFVQLHKSVGHQLGTSDHSFSSGQLDAHINLWEATKLWR